MNLYIITLKFDSGDNSDTYIGANSNEEVSAYLDQFEDEFKESGVVECNWRKVTKTDNGYKIIIQ